MFFVNFRKNASKHQKSLVYLYVAYFGDQNCFLINVPFHWFDKKKSFLSNQTFLHDLPLFKLVKKIFLSAEFKASFVTLLYQNMFFCHFPLNCFKTTEKLSLAVCGLFCGAKLFSDKCPVSLV